MSMRTAFVSFRIEPSLKKKAGVVLSQTGMSHSEAVNVFYRCIANDKGIPFSLDIPNAETRAAIRALESGKGTRVFLKDFVKEMREFE